jgi:thioredoxin reductase
VVQDAAPGGQRITTTAVENDPGCAEGILGPTLIERSVREAVASGALPALDPVTTAQTVVAYCAGVRL